MPCSGWAAGLGCQIALASDFTVAAEDSRFWLPFVKRGFTPDSGATWLLPRLVGVARAKELLLLGRPVSGADAAAWGMIHRAVPGAELARRGRWAGGRAGAPSATVAVGLTKHCVNGALDGSILEAMEREAMALELSSRTSDFREGLRAFTERARADVRRTLRAGSGEKGSQWSSTPSSTRSRTAPPSSPSTDRTS